MKKLFKYILIIFLALNLLLITVTNYSIISLVTTFSFLENKLELWEKNHELQIQIVLRAIAGLDRFQTIDMKKSEKIREANITIYNLTSGMSVSGTHIRINNHSYILTVYHIIDKETDRFALLTGSGGRHTLKLIKYDKKNDLALFKNNELNIATLEIGSEAPKIGSEVIVVGNPYYFTDMITKGIICKKLEQGYLITNKIFFGSSGGALIYKTKLVGVVSQMRSFGGIKNPVIITYGYCIGLKRVKEFLKDIK